jgi:NADPH-dependent curcumin reductase CurA
LRRPLAEFDDGLAGGRSVISEPETMLICGKTFSATSSPACPPLGSPKRFQILGRTERRISIRSILVMNLINRQILLEQIPQGKLTPQHFRLTDGPAPTPAAGEVLVRTRYVALDAANRAWMLGQTYRAALRAGQVMAGAALAEVVESRATGFAPGDLVYADSGWQDYAVFPAERLRQAGTAEPLTYLLSVFGVAGLTAYFGLLECARPKAGETVVVSAAAGAVGSIVGQIAKIKGCRAVGIAGGADKCALLTSTLGFDAAVDYKAYADNGMAMYHALQTACGGGIDVYFDNVGGAILDTCLFSMKEHGRIAACGAVSMYDGGAVYGVRAMGAIVSKRVNIRGFIVSDFRDQWPGALAELKSWVESGQLRVFEDVLDGLETLPGALVGLLAGENVGKRIVKVF